MYLVINIPNPLRQSLRKLDRIKLEKNVGDEISSEKHYKQQV